MINLLFFGSDYKVGLTTALTEQILEFNKEKEFNLFCVSSENEMESGLHAKLDNAGIKKEIIQGLDIHSNFKSLSFEIERIIKENNITHVNVHNNWQLTLVSYVKYKRILPAKFKIIYTIHGYRHNSPLKSIFAILMIGIGLLLFADRVISMSSYVSKRFWFVKYKTDLVFYMMNKPEFNKEKNIIEKFPLKMVFPAQFREGKNQDLLIKAVSDYINITKDRTVILYLPGDGYLLEIYKKLAIDLGISDNIVFCGKLPHKEVIELYEKTNIALVSSNVETYGRCIAEPFALGRCLITKDTGVALDIIRNGENGFTYKSQKQLTDILIKLHNKPNLIEYTANNAFRDKEIFSRDSIINSYINSIKKA